MQLSENEPVILTSNGRYSKVILSYEEYNRLTESKLDSELAEAYAEAEKSGVYFDARDQLTRLMNERLPRPRFRESLE